jgi:hypothetical protein
VQCNNLETWSSTILGRPEADRSRDLAAYR